MSVSIPLKKRPFDADVEAMPPPAKRVRTMRESIIDRAVDTSSSDDKIDKTGLGSSIGKRSRYDMSSPTQETDQGASKRMKSNELSPTTPRNKPGKLDPTVFASAYALASLALSPQRNADTAPHSPKSPQTRQEEDSRIDSDHASLREPTSPHVSDAVPVSPDASSPERRRRQVQFANRIRSTRTIPSRVAYNRMSNPNRIISRHGPAFPPPPYRERASFWMHPQHAPVSPPWHPPAMHHGGPPRRLPPPPPVEKDWFCDFCQVASFPSYHEACAHEATCKARFDPHNMQEQHHRDDDHSVGSSQDHQRHRSEVRDAEATQIVDDPHQIWYKGCIALAVPLADAEWLSEVNCFVREHCVEAYSATEDEISRSSKRGRIVLNQVGIRCRFCKHRHAKDKAVAAVSFPTSVSGIYESVKRWQRVHEPACQDVPVEIRDSIEELRNTSVWVPTTRQYWTDSAQALGMVDTSDGIRFMRPPSVPSGWLPNSQPDPLASSDACEDSENEEGYIALPCDKEMVPPYVYFLMRQVESCKFSDADRFVARSKGPVGFAGFQCRHCSGHAGLGKYFPLTAKSLSTNSTSQNIHAHLLKCRKCPASVKEQLLRLKSDKGKAPRLVPGWRRTFFDGIWERLHGEPPEN